MNSNPINTVDQRQCTKCRLALPLTSENFPVAKDRHLGFGYLCRGCERNRSRDKNRRYPRLKRWEQMTELGRTRKLNKGKDYRNSPNGKAKMMASGYRRIDALRGRDCDITASFIETEILSKSCCYCGDTERIGCDRLDNSRGHSRDNVVPACSDCNIARSDNFTYGEMRAVGAAIRLVKLARKGQVDLI